LRSRMAAAARTQARGESWDAVFEKVYEGYRAGIAAFRERRSPNGSKNYPA
jgi:hypothetical protein